MKDYWKWHQYMTSGGMDSYLKVIVYLEARFSDKIKCNFFQAGVVSILLYGCTTWMLTKHIEEKLDRNCTGMLRAILNKSWKQHPTKQQLYGYCPPISKTIQIRWRRHASHYWRSRDELISNVLPWAPSHGRASIGRPSVQTQDVV